MFEQLLPFLKFISAIAVVSIDAERIKSDKNTWSDIAENSSLAVQQKPSELSC